MFSRNVKRLMCMPQILRLLKRFTQSHFRQHTFCKNNHKKKPSVLISRVSPFDTSPLMISKYFNIPLIAEWNSPFCYELKNFRNCSLIALIKNWEKNFLQSSDMVYTVSDQIKSLLVSEYDLPAKKFVTIPNGFDLDIYPATGFQLRKQYSKIRIELGWKNKTVPTL